MTLADTASPRVQRGGLVLVPVGSVEQHGSHLPLDTDTVIASAVAGELAPLLGGVIAPAIAYGSSGEHQSFPGTISVGTDALRTILTELARSVTHWAARVIFVNGHGGNVEAVQGAVTLLRTEGRAADWVPCATPHADAHAGRTETSLMLHLDPGRVRLDQAFRGNTDAVATLMSAMRMGGVAAVSPNGVLGDPNGASAAEGREILQAMVTRAYDRARVRAGQ